MARRRHLSFSYVAMARCTMHMSSCTKTVPGNLTATGAALPLLPVLFMVAFAGTAGRPALGYDGFADSQICLPDWSLATCVFCPLVLRRQPLLHTPPASLTLSDMIAKPPVSCIFRLTAARVAFFGFILTAGRWAAAPA